MNFVEQLQQLDFKDIGRWPFLFRALGVLIVFVFVTILLVWWFVWSDNGNRPELLPGPRRAGLALEHLRPEAAQGREPRGLPPAAGRDRAHLRRDAPPASRQDRGALAPRRHLADGPRCRPAGAPVPAGRRRPARTSTRSCRSRSSSPAATTSSACSCPGIAALPRIVTLHDIEITRSGRANSGRKGAPAPSDELTLNLTAKTYRYLDEDESLRRARSRRQGRQGQEGQDAA